MRLIRQPLCVSTLLVAVSVLPAVGAEQWIKVQTPHFEMYTTSGEKRAREAILYFEQVRSFFVQSNPQRKPSALPVRIVAFRSESQYKPYRMNEAAFAYYVRGRSHDYIAMQDISGEHYPVTIHEYTHLIIEDSGLKLPVWLNEGWAELYSTLRPRDKKAFIGDLIPSHMQLLAMEKWLNLEALTSAGHDSALYNEKNKVGIFYAESWALVHMLYLAPEYKPRFSALVTALASGKTMGAACQSVLGKSLMDVQADLHNYLGRRQLYGALFDVKLEKSAEEPVVTEAAPFETGIALADLLTMTHKTAQARSAYTQLAAGNPGRPELDESLGYLEWETGNREAAMTHFRSAIEHGSQNARMCFDASGLEREGGHPEDALRALQRALELKPDYFDARFNLGMLLMEQRKYAQVVVQLGQIKHIKEEQAPWFFSALAYAYFELNDEAGARKNATEAKKWAKTPAQQHQAQSILDALAEREAQTAQVHSALQAQPHTVADEQRPKALRKHVETEPPEEDPTRRVQGTAQRMDCAGKTAKFSIRVGQKLMAFVISDPSKVALKHKGEGTHDFTCGPQQPYQVTVEYLPKPDSKTGTAGTVVALEF